MSFRIFNRVLFLSIFIFSTCGNSLDKLPKKLTNSIHSDGNTVNTRILVPEGCIRVVSPENSFAAYLQNLPLKPDGSLVYLFNGAEKNRQDVHAAVIDISIGKKDLQQCADAVIRLHAEYLFSINQFDKIAYDFVSDGKPRYFMEFSNRDTSYDSFLKYMEYVFNYANTLSLYNQLDKVSDFNTIRIGDVLIQTGNPYGHAVIVVDMAIDTTKNEKLFLLAQSYMPAQDIHVLKNKKDSEISPWYWISDEEKIITPEWLFYKQDLRRFKS